VGMTQVCQHGYTVCIKPDSNREPGQEVLVPDLAMSRSSLAVLTEQYDVPLRGREFALDLTFMDPCIVDYPVEIPTRCSFVIEFIIPKFVKGSTCFERDTQCPLSLGNGRSLHGHKTRGCKYSLELLMMSGVPLETC
jgi:hypothetical protein